MKINNVPPIGPYTKLEPFRFWCQKVIPLVYDESLSYYELLCKVVDYLNKTMEDVDLMASDMAAFRAAYAELVTYVNTYFDELDISTEINKKLDHMAQNGTLSALIQPFVSPIVTDWLEENITEPEGVVIDKSLTVEGAAADAKATGAVRDALEDVIDARKNRFDLSAFESETLTVSDGVITGSMSNFNATRINGFHGFKENTQYTISMEARITSSVNSDVGMQVSVMYTDTTHERLFYYRKNVTAFTKNYGTTAEGKTVDFFYWANPDVATGPTVWDVQKIQIEEGTSATSYEPFDLTAVDEVARDAIGGLLASGDTSDRAADILGALTEKGWCELDEGDFYTTRITMPAGTILTGHGDKTRLHFLGNYGPVIDMGADCTVKDITFLGSDSPITQNGDMIGIKTENLNSMNYWGNGDVTISDSYVHLVLDTPIPAGAYRITAEITTTASSSESYIGFSTSQTTSIPNDTIVATATVPKGARASSFLYVPETVYSVRVRAGSSTSTSEGQTATWANIRITKIGGNSGIRWNDPASAGASSNIVQGCRFLNFDCAGIIAYNTGTYVRNSLLISDCAFTGNNCGVYFRYNTEFNKVVNCSMNDNYYGTLNRGGNNYYANCGIDQNWINVQLDSEEGSNPAHGAFVGCSFHHGHDADHTNSGGYSLIVKDNSLNTMFNGCQMGYSKVLLEDTSGNVFSGCRFGTNEEVTIRRGACNVFAGCIVASTASVTAESNTATKIIGCFRNNGTEYTL